MNKNSIKTAVYAAVLYCPAGSGDDSRAHDNDRTAERLNEPLIRQGTLSLPSSSNARRSSTSTGDNDRHHPGGRVFGAIGAMLGVMFSLTGFFVQETFKFERILWYSLGWSCLTSFTSYLLYCGLMTIQPEEVGTEDVDPEQQQRQHSDSGPEEHEDEEDLEYSFALGVFAGFCFACTCTDLVLGMPMRSILGTVAVALLWAALMTRCARRTGRRSDDTKKTQSSNGIKHKKNSRRGNRTIIHTSNLQMSLAARHRKYRKKGTVLPIVFV